MGRRKRTANRNDGRTKAEVGSAVRRGPGYKTAWLRSLDLRRCEIPRRRNEARSCATRNHELKLGMLNYAWRDAYGEEAAWVRRHPEAFTKIEQIEPGN